MDFGQIPGYQKRYQRKQPLHIDFADKLLRQAISQFHVLETEEAYIVQPEVTVRLYVSASNLFSIDNVGEYEIDPEIEARAAVVYPQQRHN